MNENQGGTSEETCIWNPLMLHSAQVLQNSCSCCCCWTGLLKVLGPLGSVFGCRFCVKVAHRDGFPADLCRVEKQDIAPFTSLLPFHTEQSKSVVFSPLRLCAHACTTRKVVNTPNELFSVIFFAEHTNQNVLFLPHRVRFWTMALTVLRLTKKHRPCSELLIYLSTQVCSVLNKQDYGFVPCFCLCGDIFSQCIMIRWSMFFFLFFWHKIKRKAIHCASQTASIKQRSPAQCVASLHRWGATCTLTLEPSVRAAAVELKLGP